MHNFVDRVHIIYSVFKNIITAPFHFATTYMAAT